MAALSGTRARGTPTSKRRRIARFPPRHSLRLHLALLDVLIAKRADLPEAPAFARELLATLDAHDDLATLAADPVLLARVRRIAGQEAAADDARAALLGTLDDAPEAPAKRKREAG